MKLRRAEQSDAPALADIINHYIRDTTVSFSEVKKSPAEMAAIIAERREAGHGFFVAESDVGVMGYAVYGPFRSGSGYRQTREHTVLLRPEACGSGLGASLMETLERHARAAGVHSLIGGISAENEAGLRFHRKIGFKEVGCVVEAGLKAGRRIDLILVQKLLSELDATL